jgi:hypothetical protein
MLPKPTRKNRLQLRAETVLKKIALTLTACVLSAPVLAETNPAPTIAPPPTPEEQKQPRPPRAPGIAVAVAVEAALAANAPCTGNGYKTTAMITDSAGVPIVLISNDGGAAITQRVAMSKVQAVLKYGTPAVRSQPRPPPIRPLRPK